MCYRYVLLRSDLRAAAERLRALLGVEFDARYNLPPGNDVPVVRVAPGGAGREVALLHWGLVPGWTKERTTFGSKLANARAESLAEKASFRDAFRRRRCVLPASGFYEWQEREHARLPWLFRRRDGQPLLLAGLWDSWRAPDGGVLGSCTIITTGPNELMRPIHDRMPAVLTPEQCDVWLDPAEQAPARLAPLLRPMPAEPLTAVRVSKRINNLAHDDELCLRAPPAGAEAEGGGQFTLGL
ncbi:MAG TPA: SOS response-associated peptidase [Opitutaceae bacterium]|nr:SOS response-associated peptidase [Opitutaceae bacterium]